MAFFNVSSSDLRLFTNATGRAGYPLLEILPIFELSRVERSYQTEAAIGTSLQLVSCLNHDRPKSESNSQSLTERQAS